MLLTMYDEHLLSERMAERGLNYFQLALRAHVSPHTAKRVVTQGTGRPESVKRVVKALGYKLPDVVKRHNGKRKTA